MSNDLIYSLDQRIDAPGSLGIGTVRDEGKVRFVITNAGPSNVVRVRGRITGQTGFITLEDLTGSVNVAVDVFTYDEIEVIVLVYDSLTDHIIIVAQSFDGSAISFNTPDGGIDGFNTVTFTSSDDSIVITSDQLTGTIDFVTANSGTGQNYVDSFNDTTDWTGPTLGLYERTVLFTAHAKINPQIQVFEANGLVFDQVYTEISVNASYDLTIKVSSSPDLRFAGELIIS